MWLHLPSTCCPSAPERGDSTLASDWRCQLLAPSAMSRSRHMPPASWKLAWRRKPWMMRLFGRIYEPLMAEHGVARYLSSLEDTLASPSQWPVVNAPPTIPGTCGPASSASSETCDRKLFSSKTSPTICRLEDTQSSENYKRWVTRLRQHSLKRRKWALRTNGSDSSSLGWFTPVCPAPHDSMHSVGTGGKRQRELADQAIDLWPTVTASVVTGAGTQGREGGENLQTAVSHWATPSVEEGRRGAFQSASMRTKDGRGGQLTDQSMNWPTPDAGVSQDGETAGTWAARRARMKAKGYNGNGCGTPLAMAATTWPTPNTRDGNSAARQTTTTGIMHDGSTLTDAIRAFPLSRQDAPTSTRGKRSSTATRRLNPLFVEWLMGWRRGWTACDSAETE